MRRKWGGECSNISGRMVKEENEVLKRNSRLMSHNTWEILTIEVAR
jgi:hypothetical protein